jgi:ADP-heptose:LPS heptosyltransferase
MNATTVALGQPVAVRRVLAVRLDSLGDVLMCTPALQAMRKAWPDAHLTLLTSRSGAALQPHLPMIDAVMAHEASWMKAASSAERQAMPGADDMALVKALQDAHGGLGFDVAIIFTTLTQSALPAALICRMAGIAVRMAHVRENPYDLLSHWVRETDVLGPGMRHEVQRQLDLLGAIGIAPGGMRDGLVFQLSHVDRMQAVQRLTDAGLPSGRPFVLVHPGATAASRRYAPEAFGQAMDLVARTGWHCVFCGGNDERQLVARARSAMRERSLSLEGPMPLGVLGAIIERAAVLVANNSGPAHMAAAVGTPVVCLYALTNPQHTPWRVASTVLSHEVPCRDCLRSVCPQGHHACLSEVAPAQVAQATLALLRHVRQSHLQEAS